MKYVTHDVQATARHDEPACCNRAELMWMTDDLLLAAQDGRKLPTAAIDQLPPWRARMIVTVLLRAGAELEHGTPEMLDAAACAAGRANRHEEGWWRAALGLPAREVYVPPPTSPHPGAGWTVRPTPGV